MRAISPDLWEVIRVLATTVSAIAACITIILTFRSRQLERKARAPYLMVESLQAEENEDGQIVLKATIKNFGLDPARHVSAELTLFHDILLPEPKTGRVTVSEINRSNANGLPGGLSYTETFRFPRPKICAPQDIRLRLQYADPFTKEDFSPEFYYRWEWGECEASGAVEHLSREEKHLLQDYLGSNES